MNNQLRIIFHDNLLKVKIPTKIKVSTLFSHLRKALNISEHSKLVLINNTKRFSENDELSQKDLARLNKEEFMLLELNDFKNFSLSNQRKNLHEIKDTNNDKKTKSKSKNKISLQEKIKTCTNARTLINPFKVIKTNTSNQRGVFIPYYYDRVDYDDDSSEYSSEDYDYNYDSNEDDEDENYFDFYDSDSDLTSESVSVSDISRRIPPNHIAIPNPNLVQNLPFQIQRVEPQSQSGFNSANRIRDYFGNLALNPFVNRGINSNNNISNNISNNHANNSMSGNFSNGFRYNPQTNLRIIDNNNPSRRIINYDMGMLNLLTEMGFGLENSRIALRLTLNNVNEATHLLLNAPEMIFEENRDLAGPNNNDNNIPNNYNNRAHNSQSYNLQTNPLDNIRFNSRNNSQQLINNNSVGNNRNNLQNPNLIIQGISTQIERVRTNLNNLRSNQNNIEHNVSRERDLENHSYDSQSGSNISNVNENRNRPNHNQNVGINNIADEAINLNADELQEIRGTKLLK